MEWVKTIEPASDFIPLPSPSSRDICILCVYNSIGCTLRVVYKYIHFWMAKTIELALDFMPLSSPSSLP